MTWISDVTIARRPRASSGPSLVLNLIVVDNVGDPHQVIGFHIGVVWDVGVRIEIVWLSRRFHDGRSGEVDQKDLEWQRVCG